MKPSQLISSKDIDDEYDKMHGDNETLRTEKAALTQALEELVLLKDMKDHFGDSPDYRTRKPLAWEAARQVLNTLEE
jgi:hypothetical protein